jgi:MoxR-like ATPase
LRLCVLCLVGEGHLILEDFPGVGKTMLAKALARSLDVSFSRMQFTPDLLPSDVTGVNVFNQRSNEFEFRPGPVFANLLLVDEINRASPKTQAALLECMQEQQVTIDGVSYELARPFMVMATQNPIEYEGTYPLPEAQLDRFTMRIAIGYPPLSEEAKMLTEQTADPPLDALQPVANAADAIALADEAKAIFVEESLNRYVVALLRATRGDSQLYLGASPRAGIAILRVAKARALADGGASSRTTSGGRGRGARAPADPRPGGPLDRLTGKIVGRRSTRPQSRSSAHSARTCDLRARLRGLRRRLGLRLQAPVPRRDRPPPRHWSGLGLGASLRPPVSGQAWLGRSRAHRGRRRADRGRASADGQRAARVRDTERTSRPAR